MERLSEHTIAGISAEALRKWGMVFLVAGLIGRGVIQGRTLGIGSVSTAGLLDMMADSGTVMTLATVSLLLQAMETCATPIFALLLVEGAQHTRSQGQYLGRVVLLAVVSEIPYNLAMSGNILDFGSRNPVFGLALSLVMLLFYCRYSAPGAKNLAIKLLVTVAAALWGVMLSADHGAPMVLVTAALWAMRRKPMYRSFVGAAVSVACMPFSPFYMASPMGFMAVHMYNGTRNEDDSRMHYLAYPVLALMAALLGSAAAGLI